MGALQQDVNERIPLAPPTAFHRSVASVLSAKTVPVRVVRYDAAAAPNGSGSGLCRGGGDGFAAVVAGGADAVAAPGALGALGGCAGCAGCGQGRHVPARPRCHPVGSPFWPSAVGAPSGSDQRAR